MKVIALVGDENTGKSHTINVVYSFLLRDGYTQIPGYFRELGNPKYEDFMDILSDSDKKIGFVGLGDYIKGEGKSLKSLLSELNQKGCDVVICACRDNSKIITAVTSYVNHHIVYKTPSKGKEDERIVNVKDAQSMIVYI